MLFAGGIALGCALVSYILALKLSLLAQLAVLAVGVYCFGISIKEDTKKGIVGSLSIGITFCLFVLPAFSGALIGNLVFYFSHKTAMQLPGVFDTLRWLVTP